MMVQVVSTASKKQVNRAARYLADLRGRLLAGQVAFDDLPQAEVKRILECAEKIEGWRERHAGPLRNANANLRHYVRPYAALGQDLVSVTQRLKKFSTILDKLGRYPRMELTRMEDIGGVRAILPAQEAADEVARRLRKNWKVHRYRDYVREPKDSGYRALHLIVAKQDVKVEVQLRTYLQDFWANQVERDSRHLRVDYKSGRGAEPVHAYYVAMSELFAMREASIEPSREFNIELRNRYTLARPFLGQDDTTGGHDGR